MDKQPTNNSKALKYVRVLIVAVLWLLPGWLVWRVYSQPPLQRDLLDWHLGVLTWYPVIAVLMLFFTVVLFRRLPESGPGLCVYIGGAFLMPWLHWWLSGVGSPTLLFAEWATFSLTLFVLGFSVELFRRILLMAHRGAWVLAVFGGALNIVVFVVPGVLIAASLYTMLYQQGLFGGGLLRQLPYIAALCMAVWHDWRSFRSI